MPNSQLSYLGNAKWHAPNEFSLNLPFILKISDSEHCIIASSLPCSCVAPVPPFSLCSGSPVSQLFLLGDCKFYYFTVDEWDLCLRTPTASRFLPNLGRFLLCSTTFHTYEREIHDLKCHLFSRVLPHSPSFFPLCLLALLLCLESYLVLRFWCTILCPFFYF